MSSKTKIFSSFCLIMMFFLILSERSWAASSHFKFGVFGDSEKFVSTSSNGHLQKALKKLQKAKAKLVIGTGDYATSCEGDDACKTKFTSLKDLLASRFSKYYLTMGEQDRTDSSADDIWQEVFSFPDNGPDDFSENVYSFDYENSHFIILNSENPDEHEIDSDQLEWLEEDLNDQDEENIFVFFHEPAWPTNSKIGKSLDKNPSERDELWNLLAEYKVSAVFSGHEHLYARKKITVDLLPGVKNEVYQFIVGNTNASSRAKAPKAGMADKYYRQNSYVLVDVNGKNITVKNYTTSGKVKDKFSFRSK